MMALILSKEQEQFVEAKLTSGLFKDASEVIASAFESLEERMGREDPELEAMVLEGVRGEHLPYGSQTLDRVRQAATG